LEVLRCVVRKLSYSLLAEVVGVALDVMVLLV
jgi:hypothetical protein